jgi:hypothetical protein
MTRQQVLDFYFMEARAKLIDLSAFLDRVDRATGEDDFRIKALREALAELRSAEPGRAKRVLERLSDPSTEPIAAATTKAASGAWKAGEKNSKLQTPNSR